MQVNAAPHKPIRSTISFITLATIAYVLVIVQPIRQGFNGWTLFLVITMLACVLAIAFVWGHWEHLRSDATIGSVTPQWDAPEVQDGDTILHWPAQPIK